MQAAAAAKVASRLDAGAAHQVSTWAPHWSAYIIFSAFVAVVLWNVLAPAPKKAKASAQGLLPVPKKEKDHVDPSFVVMCHAYSGYAYLILRGAFLDLLQGLVGSALWWVRKSGAQGKPTSPPLSMKAGPPFNSGWVIFYTRRLYKRIQDCWNRPIAGEAGTWLDVVIRKPDGRGDAAPLVPTGEKRRCLCAAHHASRATHPAPCTPCHAAHAAPRIPRIPCHAVPLPSHASPAARGPPARLPATAATATARLARPSVGRPPAATSARTTTWALVASIPPAHRPSSTRCAPTGSRRARRAWRRGTRPSTRRSRARWRASSRSRPRWS